MAYGAASLQAPVIRIPGRDPLADTAGQQIGQFLNRNKGPGATGNDSSYVAHAAGIRQVAGGSRGGSPTGTVIPKVNTSPPHTSPHPAAPKPSPNAAPNTYGLNVNDPTPYNPFQPESQGEFNKQLVAAVKAQVQPQYQAIAGGVNAENAAAGQRGQEIQGIFSTYGQQANDAYQQTKQELQQMLAANASGDQQAQQYLSAALGGANQPGNQLNQMLGLPSTPGGETTPYNLAALGMGTSTQDAMTKQGEGDITAAGMQLGNAGLEQAQASNAESLRHQAALEGYSGQRQALAGTIPNLLTTTRQQLGTQAEQAATTALQNRLATQEFGLAKQAQGFNENQTLRTFYEAKGNDAQRWKTTWAQIGQNNRKLDIEARSVQASIDATNVKNLQTYAKLNAQQSQGVSKYLETYLAPTKEEYSTTSTPNLKTGGTTRATVIDGKKYLLRMNPTQLMQQLETNFQLTPQQALQSMSGITVKYGYNPKQTMGEWAQLQLEGMGLSTPANNKALKGAATKAVGAASKIFSGGTKPQPNIPVTGTDVTAGPGGKIVPVPSKTKRI